MIDFKKFFKVMKHYINYLMKLGFKELLVNFIEIIIVVVLASLVYLPVGLVKELVYKIFVAISGGSTFVYNAVDIFFTIVAIILCVWAFIYLFIKRFENVEQLRGSRQDNLYLNKNDKKPREEVKEDLDLPKAKEERKKFN